MPGKLGVPGRGAWTVYKRELKQYFQSPGTYVALAFFFILSGALFTLIIGDFVELSMKAGDAAAQTTQTKQPLNATESVVTQLFLALNFVMLFVIPMLTMRLIADEKKSGTFELLASTPLSDWDILLGKFFAALTVGASMLAVCMIYPVICSFYTHIESPVVVACYLGLFLLIISYTAFGTFASALSDSQIVAGVLSFVGLLVFYMVGMLFKAGFLGLVGAAFSLKQHSENFTKGIISLSDVTFFVLFSAFFLYVTAQILDARRWRA